VFGPGAVGALIWNNAWKSRSRSKPAFTTRLLDTSIKMEAGKVGK
jgi:hypothetical protein